MRRLLTARPSSALPPRRNATPPRRARTSGQATESVWDQTAYNEEQFFLSVERYQVRTESPPSIVHARSPPPTRSALALPPPDSSARRRRGLASRSA